MDFPQSAPFPLLSSPELQIRNKIQFGELWRFPLGHNDTQRWGSVPCVFFLCVSWLSHHWLLENPTETNFGISLNTADRDEHSVGRTGEGPPVVLWLHCHYVFGQSPEGVCLGSQALAFKNQIQNLKKKLFLSQLKIVIYQYICKYIYTYTYICKSVFKTV